MPRSDPNTVPQWHELTPTEIGALTEGCGVPDFDAPELWFHDSCRHHDFLYWLGGDGTHRAVADTTFRADMLADAATAPTLLERMWRRFWAHSYFYAVRWFGGFFATSFGPRGTPQKTWADLYREVYPPEGSNPHGGDQPRGDRRLN